MDLPQTRVIGSAPPRPFSDATTVAQRKFDSVLDRLHKDLMSSTADVTAIQLSDQEEFLIAGSSSLFRKFQGQDIQNIIWQKALCSAY